MHRQFSLQPFSRHYSHSTHPFLDFLDISDGNIEVTTAEREQLKRVLKEYKRAQLAGTLLTLTFVTVNDYLWLLRAVSQELSVLGRQSMYYLAAAVSDFFLPTRKIVRSYLLTGSNCAHDVLSQNTRSSLAKVAFQSKWTRYQRS
jgi:phosphopantothenate---cysteine ligase (ATP)